MEENCCCLEKPGDNPDCKVYVIHTPDVIKALKASWCGDPCWDIEATEGFALYHDELLAYHLLMVARWDADYQEELRAYASRIGLDANLKLAKYIRQMNENISDLKIVMQSNNMM